jgi:uncharacterized protein (TIGR02118 family)
VSIDRRDTIVSVIVIEFITLDGIVTDPDGSGGTPAGGWAFQYGPEAVADPEAFGRHYREVHIPLARQLPALRRYTVGGQAAAIRGAAYYLIAELEWDTMEDLRVARRPRYRRRRGTPARTRPGAQHDLHRGQRHVALASAQTGGAGSGAFADRSIPCGDPTLTIR